MGVPTPKRPVVLNEDGSISALVYRARTFRLRATHAGLSSTTGYKARFAMTDKYGNPPFATASTEAGADGTITFTPAASPATGTVIAIEIPDEAMDTAFKAGKMDLVLEEPGGAEIPVFVGDWVIWKDVSP
jgi:hypothetical protein